MGEGNGIGKDVDGLLLVFSVFFAFFIFALFFLLAFSKVFGRGGLAARIIAMSRSSPRNKLKSSHSPSGEKRGPMY